MNAGIAFGEDGAQAQITRGQGGNPLTHKLADRGWRVALVEKKYLGGYRLKVGTIPMAWVARAVETGETAGLMKVVIDAGEEAAWLEK